jgi:hypothetical protein
MWLTFFVKFLTPNFVKMFSTLLRTDRHSAVKKTLSRDGKAPKNER